MKFEFWKHETEILFICPLMITLSSMCILVGIFLTIIISKIYWFIILLGIFCLILCIGVIFLQKKTLTKVVFTEKEIILKRLNKELTSISWSQITKVKDTPYSRAISYLTFLTDKNQIDVVLTKKMYETIMLLCPYQDIKNQINNIECFRWFHKYK